MVSATIRAMRENPTRQEIVRRVQHGVSPRYQGDYTRPSNRPVNIPNSANCSLWITNLPPSLTHRELLWSIRDIDRVWQTVVNAPAGGHLTSAAKITFFTPAGAQALLRRCNGLGLPGLTVGDHHGQVGYNRNRVAQPVAPANHTRVLVIKGPTALVNVEFLTAYFCSRFYYEIDEVVPWVMGKEAIERDTVLRGQGVSAWFEADPCDVRR
ncbi:hypothetical protein C8A00DRAFT_46986 [Chaetomidium leptoderma]|uniref:RRM domain-containing protein n=1 Tax=Chaetomidium leptoderma TaxID=669021 RepID=A0AAN6VDC0_9PEZI|nr:hypothetical protein C8A00DRAFT_46986 [Chaetomidium leptoderma]